MDKKESPYLLDKAKFKSRRGLNELDQILVPFVQNEFNSLEEKEKFLLVELLEFEDVDLADLILYRKIEPEIKFEEIILKIIKFKKNGSVSFKKKKNRKNKSKDFTKKKVH